MEDMYKIKEGDIVVLVNQQYIITLGRAPLEVGNLLKVVRVHNHVLYVHNIEADQSITISSSSWMVTIDSVKKPDKDKLKRMIAKRIGVLRKFDKTSRLSKLVSVYKELHKGG